MTALHYEYPRSTRRVPLMTNPRCFLHNPAPHDIIALLAEHLSVARLATRRALSIKKGGAKGKRNLIFWRPLIRWAAVLVRAAAPAVPIGL